jgi:hypothetical protein
MRRSIAPPIVHPPSSHVPSWRTIGHSLVEGVRSISTYDRSHSLSGLEAMAFNAGNDLDRVLQILKYFQPNSYDLNSEEIMKTPTSNSNAINIRAK